MVLSFPVAGLFCQPEVSIFPHVVGLIISYFLSFLVNHLLLHFKSQEIEALDTYNGEPWCELVSTTPSTTPGTIEGVQPSLPLSTFAESPRVSQAGSTAILSAQATPPHTVARHDIMDVTIHLPVRANFRLNCLFISTSMSALLFYKDQC